jgi:AcrR family transcriptional regulator
MPRPRFENLSPERREQMLEVAGQEFAQHGYDGASLNHILEAAGVSKGAAYYYFDDKADLFVTVVRHYWAHLQSHSDFDLAQLDAKRFWPALYDLYRHGIAHLKEAPWMLGVAKSVWRLSKESRGQKQLAEVFADSQAWMQQFLAQGQEVGAIRNDLPSDLLISLLVSMDAAWDQWFLEHLDSLSQERAEEIIWRLLQATRAMLEPPKKRGLK